MTDTYDDRLWNGIRARVQAAGLAVATFEELEPHLKRGGVEALDQIMKDKGFPCFITNLDLTELVADQLNECRNIKEQYGSDVCIAEIGFDKYGTQVPDSVAIYTKTRDIPIVRDCETMLQEVGAELRTLGVN